MYVKVFLIIFSCLGTKTSNTKNQCTLSGIFYLRECFVILLYLTKGAFNKIGKRSMCPFELFPLNCLPWEMLDIHTVL